MSDLINRNDIYKLFENGIAKLHVSDIDVIPTVDAVEIVRCRDCKWADPCICVVCEEGKTVVCGRLHMHVNKDGFCSYGERKEVSE